MYVSLCGVLVLRWKVVHTSVPGDNVDLAFREMFRLKYSFLDIFVDSAGQRSSVMANGGLQYSLLRLTLDSEMQFRARFLISCIDQPCLFSPLICRSTESFCHLERAAWKFWTT